MILNCAECGFEFAPNAASWNPIREQRMERLRQVRGLAREPYVKPHRKYMGPEMTSHMVGGVRVLVSRMISVEKKRKFLEYLEDKMGGKVLYTQLDFVPDFGHVPNWGPIDQIYGLYSRDGHEYMEEDRLPRTKNSPKYFISNRERWRDMEDAWT